MKDCPNRRAFIATEDGYVSASDVEDDLALAANIDADFIEGDHDKEAIIIDSVAAAADYPSLLVQRVLSTHVGIVLIFPSGAEFEMSSQLDFYCTNNQIEYQALLFGLIMLRSMGVKHVEAYGDSLLVV
jgi:hypothetical protein